MKQPEFTLEGHVIRVHELSACWVSFHTFNPQPEHESVIKLNPSCTQFEICD